ncbi:MAG TPA: AAA family ATPase [Candidatus Acidoferrum sp.]|nr:AAA family ATPase [Candidatus Acidoferrum sp.]
MITKFKVHCFKSIENAELDLGNINVFIGANGSGKSNLLEALGVLAAAAYGHVDQESLVRRGCRPGGIFEPMFRDAPSESETSLQASNGRETYFAEFMKVIQKRSLGSEFRREVWQSGERKFVDRSTLTNTGKGDPKAGLAALKLAEMDAADPASVFLKTLSAYSIYSPEAPVLRGLMQDPQVREPVGLSGGRLVEGVTEVLNDPNAGEKLSAEFHASMDWFENFFTLKPLSDVPKTSSATQVFPDGPMLAFLDRFFRKENAGSYFLLASEVNEGALYLLFMAVLCLHPASPRLFALDNADHGLNPLMARRLMTTMCRWLLDKDQPRQVLMTTQNPLVLDGLPLQDDRVRLFTVDRDNRGTTCFKRFLITDEHQKKAAEGWTLSRMWVNGLIGGVPNV